MNNKIMATLGAAALALTVSATASQAHLGFEMGETLGQALGAPLPEGVFFLDNEAYGRRDIDAAHGGGGGTNTPGPFPNVGVNIPTLVWATPFTAYDTRLEFLYAAPFIHTDGPTNAINGPGFANRVDIFQQAFGPILAHDFGHDFGGSLILFVRPPSEHFRQSAYADLRASLSYTGPGLEFLGSGNLDLTATFGYTGTFGGFAAGASDAIDVDFTATKKFGKFEFGLVGYYMTDINNRADNTLTLGNGQVVSVKESALAFGGLVGYDFGRFTLQAYATRDVISHNQLLTAFGGFSNPETRGFVRLIVPLYVAPAAPPLVRARF